MKNPVEKVTRKKEMKREWGNENARGMFHRAFQIIGDCMYSVDARLGTAFRVTACGSERRSELLYKLMDKVAKTYLPLKPN